MKTLSAFLRGIKPKHVSDTYCLNCQNRKTKNKLKYNEKVCQNKGFFGVLMPSENTKIS